ncbi:hypothetical protein BR93DRAFT_954115 [Coniochaeta sp. PMI_546]|nr:hypothetical protein BR93DRAFT_954115 [Coniochaeta sp. PMI_546]
MDFPQSDNTVRVKLLDTTTYLTGIAQVFVTPVAKGHETFNFKDVAFLIEHDGLGKKAMFDLGTRRDYWNSPPAVQALLGSDTAMTGVRVDKEVSEILEEGGVKLSSIDYCIWSHFHYDHCGNMSQFPPSTSVVVGPGFKSSGVLPGYPENPKSPVLASDLASGASFMLLGGDISHFAGHFRPSAALPLPDTIPVSAIPHLSSDQSVASKTPWYGMPPQWPTAYHDYETARASVLKMQELDAKDNVFVCLAHDAMLLDVLPVFNKDPGKDCNNWRESGWKQKCHWGWLNEVPVDGQPAHSPIVKGFWRDGKQWDYDLYKKQSSKHAGTRTVTQSDQRSDRPSCNQITT